MRCIVPMQLVAAIKMHFFLTTCTSHLTAWMYRLAWWNCLWGIWTPLARFFGNTTYLYGSVGNESGLPMLEAVTWTTEPWAFPVYLLIFYVYFGFFDVSFFVLLFFLLLLVNLEECLRNLKCVFCGVKDIILSHNAVCQDSESRYY